MGKLIVKKFGGTSVANTERIEVVADNIQLEIEKGNQVAVVLSAMGKSTDELISLAKETTPQLLERKFPYKNSKPESFVSDIKVLYPGLVIMRYLTSHTFFMSL